MHTENALTNTGFWNKSYYKRGLSVSSPFQKYFDAFLPRNPTWSVIEIGACPGNNLAAVSKSHAYKPHAIDFLPEVREMPAEFHRHGLPKPRIYTADFLTWAPGKTFEVVMSFGFIEHFHDWQSVLRKHWDIVARNGFMVVGIPVFGPMQMLLRKLVLKPERLSAVLSSHNLEATNLGRVVRWCDRLENGQVVFADHIWEMHTWLFTEPEFLKDGTPKIEAVWRSLARFPERLRWSSRLFSPYALLIVRKED